MSKIAEKKKTLGSAKRFGPRYGRTVKEKLLKAEKQARTSYKCPYCHKEKVKRESIGIWSCKKCGSKFTGKAYSLPKKVVIKEEIAEEIIEEETEKEPKEEDKGVKYSEKNN